MLKLIYVNRWRNVHNEGLRYFYRGADKSLARPDRKNNLKVAIFRPTRRSLPLRRPGWTDDLLNFLGWLAKVRVWSL